MREYRSKWAEVYRLLHAIPRAGAPDVKAFNEAVDAAYSAALASCRGPKRGRSLGVFVARTLDNHVKLSRGAPEKKRQQAFGQLTALMYLAAREAGLRYEVRARRLEHGPPKTTDFVQTVLTIYRAMTAGIP